MAGALGITISCITGCLKAANVIKNIVQELRRSVPDEDIKNMEQKIDILIENLQKIKNSEQIQHCKGEITRLHSQLQHASEEIKDINEKEKKAWYNKIIPLFLRKITNGSSIKAKFESMEAKLALVVQSSILIVTTLNLKLASSTKKQLATMKPELGSLKDHIKVASNSLKKEMTLKLNTIIFLQFNDVWSVENQSVTSPDPPNITYIKESKGKLIVKWQTQCSKTELFGLCYDEEDNHNLVFDRDVYEAKIGLPQVQLVPGKIYTVKLCGINSGGRGKWSYSSVHEFTKPCPCQPNPPKISIFSSSTVKVTVIPPKQACPTETPVTKWKIEYAVQSEREWKLLEKYRVKDTGKCHLVYKDNFFARQKYYLRIKGKNAEGWSTYSKPVTFEMPQPYTHSTGFSSRTLILMVIMMLYMLFLCIYHQQ